MTVTKPPTGNPKKVQGKYLSPQEQREKRLRRKVEAMTDEETAQLEPGSAEYEMHAKIAAEAAVAEAVVSAAKLPASKIVQDWLSPQSSMSNSLMIDMMNYSPKTDVPTYHSQPQKSLPSKPPGSAALAKAAGTVPLYLRFQGKQIFLGFVAENFVMFDAANNTVTQVSNWTYLSHSNAGYLFELPPGQSPDTLKLFGWQSTCTFGNGCPNPSCYNPPSS